MRHPLTGAAADAAGRRPAVLLPPLAQAAAHSETAGRHRRLGPLTAASHERAPQKKELQLRLISGHAGNLWTSFMR